jgi:hypothetical protein
MSTKAITVAPSGSDPRHRGKAAEHGEIAKRSSKKR